jgi:hypothetical protein
MTGPNMKLQHATQGDQPSRETQALIREVDLLLDRVDQLIAARTAEIQQGECSLVPGSKD